MKIAYLLEVDVNSGLRPNHLAATVSGDVLV